MEFVAKEKFIDRNFVATNRKRAWQCFLFRFRAKLPSTLIPPTCKLITEIHHDIGSVRIHMYISSGKQRKPQWMHRKAPRSSIISTLLTLVFRLILYSPRVYSRRHWYQRSSFPTSFLADNERHALVKETSISTSTPWIMNPPFCSITSRDLCCLHYLSGNTAKFCKY